MTTFLSLLSFSQTVYPSHSASHFNRYASFFPLCIGWTGGRAGSQSENGSSDGQGSSWGQPTVCSQPLHSCVSISLSFLSLSVLLPHFLSHNVFVFLLCWFSCVQTLCSSCISNINLRVNHRQKKKTKKHFNLRILTCFGLNSFHQCSNQKLKAYRMQTYRLYCLKFGGW